MHPLRRRLLLRLLTALALILAGAAYASMTLTDPELDRPPAASKPAEVHPFIPSGGDLQLLADATRLLNEDYQGLPVWTGAERQLLEIREPVKEADSSVKVRMIFLGGHKHYAVIGNSTYTRGGILPDGRKITGINRTAVRLDSGGQASILSWTGTKTVKLVKPEKETSSEQSDTAKASISSTKDEKVSTEGETQSDKLKLDAQQAQQLMDQLKNIPGVVGTSPNTSSQ